MSSLLAAAVLQTAITFACSTPPCPHLCSSLSLLIFFLNTPRCFPMVRAGRNRAVRRRFWRAAPVPTLARENTSRHHLGTVAEVVPDQVHEQERHGGRRELPREGRCR